MEILKIRKGYIEKKERGVAEFNGYFSLAPWDNYTTN